MLLKGDKAKLLWINKNILFDDFNIVCNLTIDAIQSYFEIKYGCVNIMAHLPFLALSAAILWLWNVRYNFATLHFNPNRKKAEEKFHAIFVSRRSYLR